MATIESNYLGGLRTTAVHQRSGNEIITDAPVDNHGKGEAFSPTDLVCAALGSCMMTTMGIHADKRGIELAGMSMSITKHMQSGPRKISAVDIEFHWTDPVEDEGLREELKDIARNCPVALSLSDDLDQRIVFHF